MRKPRDYTRYGQRSNVPVVERLKPDHRLRPRDVLELAEDLVDARSRLKFLDEQLLKLSAEREQLQRLISEPSDYLAARLKDSGQVIKVDGYVFVTRIEPYHRAKLEIREICDVQFNDERRAAFQSMVDTLYPPDEPATPDAATADIGASDAQAHAAAEAVTDVAVDDEPTTELPVAVAVLDEEAA